MKILCSEHILGQEKKFGSKRILGPEKFGVQKEFLVKKNFGSERILGPKKFESVRNFGQKKIGPQTIWVKKNVGSQKMF